MNIAELSTEFEKGTKPVCMRCLMNTVGNYNARI
jgi:hypothetical protein